MNKLYIAFWVLFLSFGYSGISYSQLITTNKLECGEKNGKWEVDIGKIQRYQKGKNGKWLDYKSVLEDFHKDIIKASKLDCGNFRCIDSKKFDCEPKIRKVTQGDLKKGTTTDGYWVNMHTIVKFEWECTDCKRIYPKSKLTTTTKSDISDCADNDIVNIVPLADPGIFRLWIDISGADNLVTIIARNADNGEVVVQEEIANVNECHLHVLAFLTDMLPGPYEFEISVNGEIIKSCIVNLE